MSLKFFLNFPERCPGAAVFGEHVQRTVDGHSRICQTESRFSRGMGKTGFIEILLLNEN